MEKLIFIIDDNDANLTVAASALEAEYRVLTMASAAKMFTLLEKFKPDLILLDIEMPEMTGLEAIEILKKNSMWSEIPCLFLTGRNDEKLLAETKESGAEDIIFKPITAPVLLDYVKKYI
ncbi:MAG: response regulator [Treponema sp.]|nr:response regulator [Treponema sp.]MCL2271491.1 response regulator [Treponema sp.]